MLVIGWLYIYVRDSTTILKRAASSVQTSFDIYFIMDGVSILDFPNSWK